MQNRIIQYSLILVLLIMGTSANGFAQKSTTKTSEPKAGGDNLNKKDAQNKKQGMWFYDIPSRFGDPAYYEFGAYENDMKTGMWYKLTKDQQLISIENYKYDVLNGAAQYYENGRLVSMGTYRGIYTPYKFDTVYVIDPITQFDSTVVIPSEKGFTKHGTWRYYDANTGHLVQEREYQVDILLKERNFNRPQIAADSTTNKPKYLHEGAPDKTWQPSKRKGRDSLIK